MLTRHWAHIEALRFIGICGAVGAVLGSIISLVRKERA